MGTSPIPESFEDEPGIGLVTALPAELRCLTDSPCLPRVPKMLGNGLTCIIAGIGPDNARKAAESISATGIKLLISWGTAGAVDRSLKQGDLVLPETIQSREGQIFPVDDASLRLLRETLSESGLRIHQGTLLETDHVISSREEKRELAEETTASTVDMESATLAEFARNHDMRFIAIRAVVDNAHEIIPRDIINHINEYGMPRKWPMIKAVIRNPLLIFTMLALSAGMRAASKTLHHVAKSTDDLSILAQLVNEQTDPGSHLRSKNG